ncbi:O-antigen ligase family protein [Pseudomonas baetica]|uniref:O-antigen ligase family protein n=1 Tax=Pseudomonas baetica TaxID=674054 RepID=UPI0024052F24|nr:hypothetical protein [Pseudomonas baetica]MDF9777871.1 hypothetical protein [Pseudomonas baetica]
MNNKTGFTLVTTLLLLSIFIKNISILVPFHILFSAFFLISVTLKPKQIKLKPVIILLFFTLLMLIAFTARNFGGIGDEIHILIYFLLMLPFFIFTTTCNLSRTKEFGKIAMIFFIVMNSLGILAFLFTVATRDHAELVILFNGEASESRKILINSLDSFVFADTWGYRYSGFYLDPNRWSFCLVFMYMFTDTCRAESKKLQFICKGLILASLLLTFSKGGYVGLLAYLTIRAILERKTASIVYFAIIITAIASFIFIFSDTDQILERAIYGFDSGNGKSRINTWPAYFYEITKDPINLLFGVFTDADLTKTMPINPHNLPLFITYQFGSVFFLCFIAVLYGLYRKANRLKHRNRAFLISGFLSLILMSLTEDEVLLPIFWFAGAFIYATLKNAKTPYNKSQPQLKPVMTQA